MKKKPLFLFLLCYAAYTAIYMARLNLSVAEPGLRDAGVLTSAQYGVLGSVFSLVYACGRLLNGILGDRRSPRFMISVGLLLTGAVNLLLGCFPPYAGMLLCWAANAFAQSMLWSSILCTVSALYGEQAPRKTPFMVTSVAAGNVLGIVVCAQLIRHLGLKWAFLLPGGVTLALGLAVFFCLTGIPAPAESRAHENLFQLAKNREIRSVLAPTVFHGVMKDNVTLWMTAFFIDRFRIDLAQSAAFVLFIPLIGFAGRTLYPLVYRLCRYAELKVAQYAFVLCAVCAAVLCFGGLTPTAAMICLSLIYAAVSMANSTFLSIYPMRFADSGNIASVSGLMDFFTYLGAGAASMIYGLLVDRFGYSPMFLSWALVSILSVVLLVPVLRRISAREEKAAS